MTTYFVTLLLTYLLFWGFLSATAFLAGRFVLGTGSVPNAVITGAIPGFIVLVTAPRLSPAFVLLGFAITDVLVIWGVYRESIRTTAYLAAIHYTISVVLGLAIVNLVENI